MTTGVFDDLLMSLKDAAIFSCAVRARAQGGLLVDGQEITDRVVVVLARQTSERRKRHLVVE